MSEIFRKKSLDRVNSPEDLNEYMRVTNPPVWFALIAVILLLCGAIVWGCTSKLETKAQAIVVSDGEKSVCYISEKYISSVGVGTVVRIGRNDYTVTQIGSTLLQSDTVLSDYQRELAGFASGEGVYTVELDKSAGTGNYEAYVVLEEISPISFLLGSSD